MAAIVTSSVNFRRQHRGDLKPPEPRIDLFLDLPVQVVRELVAVGLTFIARTGRATGRPRYELLVLSYFAGLWKRSKGHEGTIRYHDGFEVSVGADEFVVSMLTVARAVWTRTRLVPVPEAERDDAEFDSFYRTIQRCVGRLEEHSMLVRLGPARPGRSASEGDLYGLRWTMAGTPVDDCVDELDYAPPHPAVLARRCEPPLSPDIEYGDNPLPLLYDSLFAELGHPSFQYAFVKVGGFRKPEREVRFLDWQRNHARRNMLSGPKHVSVGCFLKGQATYEARHWLPCTMPFLIAEIDVGDRFDPRSSARCLDIAKLLVERLKDTGGDLDQVIVTYSGNRSFHVRIPHGMVGIPIFRRASAAKYIVAGFFERLTAGLVGVYEALDQNLFNPPRLIRAIGSVHEGRLERTGEKLYSVAFRGREILEPRLTLDLIQQFAFNYSPARLPDPDKVAPVPLLVSFMEDAISGCESAAHAASAGENRGIIKRIKEGDIRPGEAFHPGYEGRTVAALIYSLYMLTHEGRSEGDAFGELRRWNAELPVPIGQADDDGRDEFREIFRRAKDYALKRVLRRGR